MSNDDEFDLDDPEAYFDDASVHPGSSRFLQLPAEILTAIIESGFRQFQTDVEGLSDGAAVRFLQDLRLVHPLLASLTYPRRQLFGTVKLTSNPDKLRALERHGPDIGPYVRRIVFQQAQFSRWTLPPERQRDATATVEKLLQPRITRAVGTGRVLHTWIDTINYCRRIEDVSISTSEGSNYAVISCGPSSHVLLELALQALTESACQPRRLSIRHRTLDEFVYTKLQDWDDLDLSKLRSLEFNFTLHCGTRLWNYREVFKTETSAVLALLLEKSADTLQNLSLSGNDETLGAYFRIAPPRSPMLRSLTISNGLMDPEDFARWILQIPPLRELCIDGVSFFVQPPDLENWRPVFQAMKDHPGNLLVRLKSFALLTYAGPFWLLNMRHQVPDEPIHEPQGHFVLQQIVEMLKLYLSGVNEWNVEDYWAADYIYDDDIEAEDGDDDDDDDDDSYWNEVLEQSIIIQTELDYRIFEAEEFYNDQNHDDRIWNGAID